MEQQNASEKVAINFVSDSGKCCFYCEWEKCRLPQRSNMFVFPNIPAVIVLLELISLMNRKRKEVKIEI